MINASEQAKSIMNHHLHYVASDRRRLSSKESVAKLTESMRLAQIEMIRSHWDNMDEETQARAKRTLDQIGGNDLIRVAL